jgi:hypothetical protein
MLLTHTAGFGYAFLCERLRDYGYPAGIDEFSGDIADVTQPLLFQPGEGWEYGVCDMKQSGMNRQVLISRRQASTGRELRSRGPSTSL